MSCSASSGRSCRIISEASSTAAHKVEMGNCHRRRWRGPLSPLYGERARVRGLPRGQSDAWSRTKYNKACTQPPSIGQLRRDQTLVGTSQPPTERFQIRPAISNRTIFRDFACRERSLVVEIDGSQHADSKRDIVRDEFMNAEGWSVARFWNIDVLTAMPSVLDTIVAICDGRLTDPIVARDLKFFPATRQE